MYAARKYPRTAPASLAHTDHEAHHHVDALAHPRLAAPRMEHPPPSPVVLARRGRGALGEAVSDVRGERDLHADQPRDPEHVHAVIDLPTTISIADMMKLYKG